MPVSRRKALIDKPGRTGHVQGGIPQQQVTPSMRRRLPQAVRDANQAGSIVSCSGLPGTETTCRYLSPKYLLHADQDPRSALASEDAANVDHGP